MNEQNDPTPPRPRLQVRLGSLMAFITGFCALLAVLAALKVDLGELLLVFVLFSGGAGVIAAVIELTMMMIGSRDRQRQDVNRRRD